MQKIIQNNDAVEIEAKLKLKVGDTIRTTLPSDAKLPVGQRPVYTTTVSKVKFTPESTNYFSIKVPVYNGWFDVGYVIDKI